METPPVRPMENSDVHVHPTALVESERVGRGTRVWAFAHVLKGAVVGEECNVGDHAYIEGGAVVGDRVTIKNGNALWEGVTLEDGVFVGPAVTFTNDRFPRSPRLPEAAHRYGPEKAWYAPTLVRYGATLGAGSILVAGVTVGRFATVGAGAVVTRDVPDHALVAGNPAVVKGWMCACGLRLRFEGYTAEAACEGCGRRYVKHGESVLPAAEKEESR